VGPYLSDWLKDVIVPNSAPSTAANYDMFVRLYSTPYPGDKRLDKLTARDVQTWINKLRETCQCCAQGKDARREAAKCCAKGECCKQFASTRTVRDACTVLRSALSNAVREELVPRNVGALARMPQAQPQKVRPWSVEEARLFLEPANAAADPRYAAYVLVLVLGLRRGELLGLRWDCVDLERGELRVGWQLQRVAGKLLHRQTKTAVSEALLPMPGICVAALKVWRARQDRWREDAGKAWQDKGFVFSTRLGMPVEPRNFHRDFKKRSTKAEVPIIPVHTTRSLAPGRAGRPPSGGGADPPAQSDCRHDERLQRGLLGRHPRGATAPRRPPQAVRADRG